MPLLVRFFGRVVEWLRDLNKMRLGVICRCSDRCLGDIDLITAELLSAICEMRLHGAVIIGQFVQQIRGLREMLCDFGFVIGTTL